MNYFNPIIEAKEDGLLIPEVREWSLEKYRLVGSYCDIFTSGMKNKWKNLVYIDLFAGAGFAKIIETGKVYYSSSMIALSVNIPFTKYILCEQDPYKFHCLKTRIESIFPNADVTLINKDCNEAIEEILRSIPAYSKQNTVLPFCFVDPYSVNFNFNTIKKLGDGRLMDFLILQALQMDAKRNLSTYLNPKNERIANYLGKSDWREAFNKNCGSIKTFVKFLADQYQVNMKELGYIAEHNMHRINSNEKNLPLYYLAFYSKHSTGIQFFKEIEKRVNPQITMAF